MSHKNEEEAKKAIDVAEKKLSENDYFGAKKFANKAQSLHPEINGLKQLLMMIDVYISASNRVPDWYGVLGVDPSADEETVKRQYKKLALLIHPDKNKFNGAEEATKFVLEAWSVLSDETKRILYNQERKSKSKMKKHKRNPKPEPEFYSESNSYPIPVPTPDKTFWTVCNRCKTYCQFGKNNNLNKTLVCPNCGEGFVATEIPVEIVNERPIIRFRFFKRYTRRSTSDGSSSSTSASESAKAEHYESLKRWLQPERYFYDPEADSSKAAHHERMKRWFEPELYFNKPEEADSSKTADVDAEGGDAEEEAERLFKKPMTTGDANTCSEAESLFEKPNADSTLEAERLFKKPMATGESNTCSGEENLFEKTNADSTLEAERLFKKPMPDLE